MLSYMTALPIIGMQAEAEWETGHTYYSNIGYYIYLISALVILATLVYRFVLLKSQTKLKFASCYVCLGLQWI